MTRTEWRKEWRNEWRKIAVAVATLGVLAAVNAGIAGRERLLTEGRTVYLELAPVDPRSLMQGDYMALRFAIADEAFRTRKMESPRDGHIVAAVDARGVANFRRLADGRPLAPDEVLLRYRVRNGDVKFATNAFFFEEGQAARYEQARFGAFRVDRDGEMILTGLRDAGLKDPGSGAR